MTAQAPAIVLVEPQLGENIGMAARAMLNSGLTDLRLVRPRDGWPNEKALLAASGATAVIERARVCQTLVEAISDCHVVFATTYRQRELHKRIVTPRQAMGEARQGLAAGTRTAVLFGPERTGLWSDDVAAAHAILTIPMNPAFPSLNLAQAVGIVAYEWFQSGEETPPVRWERGDSQPAKQEEFRALLATLEALLDDAGFFFPPEKRQIMWHNLQAFLARAEPSSQEVGTLFGAIKALSGLRARAKPH